MSPAPPQAIKSRSKCYWNADRQEAYKDAAASLEAWKKENG